MLNVSGVNLADCCNQHYLRPTFTSAIWGHYFFRLPLICSML